MQNISQKYFSGVGDYRHSFQGQEKDDEIKGVSGSSINYKYRMHDPRIGRFFAVDPLAGKYPHNSPYAFSENRVIDGVELEGLEVVTLSGKPEVLKSYLKVGTYDLSQPDGAALKKWTDANLGIELKENYTYVMNVEVKKTPIGDPEIISTGHDSPLMRSTKYKVETIITVDVFDDKGVRVGDPIKKTITDEKIETECIENCPEGSNSTQDSGGGVGNGNDVPESETTSEYGTGETDTVDVGTTDGVPLLRVDTIFVDPTDGSKRSEPVQYIHKDTKKVLLRKEAAPAPVVIGN